MIRRLESWIKHKQLHSPAEKSLGARLAGGAFWSLTSHLVVHAMGLVSSIFTARLLGKVGLGELGMITGTVGALSVFASLGLGVTATKYVAQLHDCDPKRAASILGLSHSLSVLSGLASSALLLIFAPILANGLLNAPHLADLLRVACVLVLIGPINGVQRAALAGFEAFRAMAQIDLICGLLRVPVVIVGVWLFGLAGAVGAAAVTSAARWVISHRALRRECDRAHVAISYRGALAEWRVLAMFSLPALLCGILVRPVLWLARIIVANQPGGYSELGLLAAANQWRSVIKTLPAILSSVALPILSSQHAPRENSAAYGKAMDITQSVAVLAVVPATTLIMLLGDWIMRLYGSGFSDGTPVLVGIVFGLSLSALGSAAGAGIAAQEKLWLGALMNLVWGATLLALLWLAAPAWGARAYALGFGVAYTILFAWSYVILRRDLPAGMIRRTFTAGGYLLLIALLSLSLGPIGRVAMAIPLFILSVLMSLFLGTGPELRRAVWKRVRSVHRS